MLFYIVFFFSEQFTNKDPGSKYATSRKPEIKEMTNDMPPPEKITRGKEQGTNMIEETPGTKVLTNNIKETSRQVSDKPARPTPWSDEEIEELKEIFHTNYERKTTPIKRELIEGLQKSKQNGGQIHQRKIESVKKKVSKMVVKLRKLSDVQETGSKTSSRRFGNGLVE